MRAPFDRFIDLFWGPDTLTPGAAHLLNVHARLVPDVAFAGTEPPLSLSLAYITLDAIEPNAPTTVNTTLQVWEYDYGKGDTVALTTGGPITHQVLRVELRTWDTGGSYWRAHIAPLIDEIPSACSVDYYDHYHVVIAAYGSWIMERVGPTTWIYGGWTLEAEIGPFDSDTCESNWKLSHVEYGGWLGVSDGTSTEHFTNPVTMTIADVQPYTP